MYRDKTTLSALIVSSSQKAADYLHDILSKLRFSPVAEAVSIADAKRRQLEKQIAALEAKIRKEKQPRKKFEMVQKAKMLKERLKHV